MVEIIEKKNWKIEYKRDLQIAEMVFANWKYNLKDITGSTNWSIQFVMRFPHSRLAPAML